MSAHTRTRISKILEILEDGVGLRSLPRFLVPALFGDLPDRWGHSWGINAARFRRSFALRDRDHDLVVCKFGKGHPSGHKLEAGTIRASICHTFGKVDAPPQ